LLLRIVVAAPVVPRGTGIAASTPVRSVRMGMKDFIIGNGWGLDLRRSVLFELSGESCWIGLMSLLVEELF
jgi:hypothetical protein